MKPYVGVIVIYKDLMGTGNPAIVNAVNEDGTVNLGEFHPSGHTSVRLKVAFGRNPGQWLWPENSDIPNAENAKVHAAAATAAAKKADEAKKMLAAASKQGA